MKDLVTVALVVVAFATFITAHVAITYGLAKRPPRWRAAAGFIVPPLGAYWGWQEKMKARVGIFVGALALDLVARVVAST